MATIKQDRKDLETMLDGIDPIGVPVGVPVTAAVDSCVGSIMSEQKVFEYDYDGTRKSLRKKAKKTVTNIVNHVLPNDMLEEGYVVDKMEQDIETLTDLYMQVENNNIMQRSLMDSVSRGNTMPRMYEVFGQLTDKIQAINKQILSTEQSIRKTYIDLKFEIRDKEGESGMTKPKGALPQSDGGSITVTSTRQMIEMAKARHHENNMKNKAKVIEAECKEV